MIDSPRDEARALIRAALAASREQGETEPSDVYLDLIVERLLQSDPVGRAILENRNQMYRLRVWEDREHSLVMAIIAVTYLGLIALVMQQGLILLVALLLPAAIYGTMRSRQGAQP